MAIHKVLLFYAFTPLPDPAAVRLWQRELATKLGITGRIIVSPQGINGAVGGEVVAVKQYVKRTREYPAFATIDFAWNEGNGTEFPRLSVKVKDELVSFGAADEVEVGPSGVAGAGTHLTPHQVHELVGRLGDEVVFFDGRNRAEAAIGRFKGAVVTSAETTRDFVAELDSGRYDALKNRPVVTYCTGGVRCEVLTSLMINRGFSEVYQIGGGVVGYGEAYQDRGLWEGSLYVFDDRRKITFSEQADLVGRCEICAEPTDTFIDCRFPLCKGQALLCVGCAGPPLCQEHRSPGEPQSHRMLTEHTQVAPRNPRHPRGYERGQQ